MLSCQGRPLKPRHQRDARSVPSYNTCIRDIPEVLLHPFCCSVVVKGLQFLPVIVQEEEIEPVGGFRRLPQILFLLRERPFIFHVLEKLTLAGDLLCAGIKVRLALFHQIEIKLMVLVGKVFFIDSIRLLSVSSFFYHVLLIYQRKIILSAFVDNLDFFPVDAGCFKLQDGFITSLRFFYRRNKQVPSLFPIFI